jgi:hypothetical protein
VASGDRAQEAVFELLGPPGFGELGALAGECLLDLGGHRVGIEDDEVVEGDRFEARCCLRVGSGGNEQGDNERSQMTAHDKPE